MVAIVKRQMQIVEGEQCMKIKKYIKGNYVAFFMIALLYFVPKYFEFTTFYYIEDVKELTLVLKNVSYFCAIIWYLIKLFKKGKISGKLLFVICLLVIYLSYQAFFRDINTLFVVFLLSLIFDERYLYKYTKVIFACSCFLYIFTVAACKLGVIENVFTERNKFGDIWIAGGNGFGYSGQMIMMLIPIVFLFYYIKNGKIKWFDNIVWVLITVVVYTQCRTIMGLVLILLFIFIYNIGGIAKDKSGFSRFLAKSKLVTWSPVIFAAISMCLVKFYEMGSSLGYYLDMVVNGRLSVASRVINIYGIKMLGTEFVNNTLDGKYEILDSEYMQMLVSGGYIYTIVALIIGVCIMKCVQKRDSSLTLIWCMIFFNAIFNNGIYGLVMNPFCIIVVPAIKDAICSGRSMIGKKSKDDVRVYG